MVSDMKNEINWQTGDDGDFPMTLAEKGLDFKGRTAVFFYISGLVAVISMAWVMILSVRLLQMTRLDANIPQYYVTIAIICIGISAVSLYSFYRIFSERRSYSKNIVIEDGSVSFVEKTRSGKTEWTEKLRKYDGIFLKHYAYRGVDSWYIALVHSDKTRSFAVFAPDYESRNASEEDKKRLLARYGSRFNLITHYEKPAKEKQEE
jgi:hypothetical protein